MIKLYHWIIKQDIINEYGDDMENIAEKLKSAYGIEAISSFVADAIYFEDLDCVKYLARDTTVISDRIDQYLTLYYDLKDEPVGLKLKGFRWYFEEKLKRLYDFTDDDFIFLIEVIRGMANEQAQVVFENPSPDNDRIKRAYKTAIKLAEGNRLHLNAYQFRQQAA